MQMPYLVLSIKSSHSRCRVCVLFPGIGLLLLNSQSDSNKKSPLPSMFIVLMYPNKWIMHDQINFTQDYDASTLCGAFL